MNKIKAFIYRFMYGRYGSDTLNKTIIWISLILIIVDMFIKAPARSVISFVVIALLVLAYARMFSRNIYARRNENTKFLQIVNRIKNIRKYKYFKCPNCKTTIRVPRHKGNIEITCPKCRNKFIKKS